MGTLLAFLIVVAAGFGSGPMRSEAMLEASSPPDVCGWWASADSPTGAALTSGYGELRSCAPLDMERSVWIITTHGAGGQRGVTAVDLCHDMACRDGRVDHPLRDWSIFPAPYNGGVTWLGVALPGVIRVDNAGHEITFDVGTDTYGSG